MSNKRIISTVIITIILLFFLIIIIRLIPFNLTEAINKWKENSEIDITEAGELSIVLVGLFGVSILAYYLVCIWIIFNSAICLIFTIKNRKSSVLAIKIINYCLDGIITFLIVTSIVKMILWSNGY